MDTRSVTLYLNQVLNVYNTYRNLFSNVRLDGLCPSDYFKITFLEAVICFKSLGYDIEYHIDSESVISLDSVTYIGK